MQMNSSKRAIDKIYRRRDRYEIPDWQREEVWDTQKKRLLIDSVLKGWKLPKFYLLQLSDDPEEFEVVDGQQRLSTIFEFFDDELTLTGAMAETWGATRYSELPQNVQDSFDDFEVEYDVIGDAQEAEIKEFFQRLQAGLPLTSSEKLNSVHSNLRDFCRRLAKHDFFQNKVYLADKRYAHFDIASKVAAIEIDGLDTSLRYDDLKETFEAQAAFSARSQVAKRLLQGFEFLDRAFDSKNSVFRHRTIVQSFATLATMMAATGRADAYAKKFGAFLEDFMKQLAKQVELGAEAHDHDLVAFQRTVNANVRTGPRTRHEVLIRRLLAFDPAVADILDPATVQQSGVRGLITRRAGSLADRIHQLNDAYSAVNGEDLFKMTNKTSTALGALSKVATSMEQYKDLVDHLYFIFHEGVGSRLSSPPASFKDIQQLRTGIRHDLDHGKKSGAAKKRRNIGETFKRYSGSPSAVGIDPARFQIVQANILTALHNDLATMKPK